LPITGLTGSQVIQQVNGRTEQRAANKPDYDMGLELCMALDEFCQEKHYWWRRKAASFQTETGETQYDLSAGTNDNGANAPDCMEIEEAFVVNATPYPNPIPVHPALNARQQISALFGNGIGETIPRNRYFMGVDGFQQFNFTSPINQVFTVGFTYYACPMIFDSAAIVNIPIPLVPPNLHYGMVDALERRVLKFLYGQGDERYATSEQMYQKFILDAAKSKQFTSVAAIHSSMGRRAVHSSGGRSDRGSWSGRE
jgi:hypothetical protein